MKILVTGGAGYIGSACVEALCHEGYQVVVFDDLSTGQADKINSNVILEQGSIIDYSNLKAVCARYDFGLVLHFAAKKAVGESQLDPALYFETNVTGTLNLLKVMSEYQIPKIVFSSTAVVYRPPKDTRTLTESSPLGPQNVYGQTKRMAEEMIVAFAKAGLISNYSILRYFNVAGDVGLNYRESKAMNIFPIIGTQLQANLPVQIFGSDYETADGTCVRDYIHLRDLVKAHLAALNQKESGIYNLGTGKGYSVKELLDRFNQIATQKIRIEAADRRSGDSPFLVADATLAKQKLGWQPEATLDDIIKDTLRVFNLT
ncbi:MAG TPA: UDP-glucose 4-epimerase GalE [Candidatus Paceibacterota bacterium]|nr:UDP-glucose 4-epimerase GalE [Candidatus Paceibacterota bacterium]HMO82771.1 UDP-glucose 4-epimerase GalE [Candidatus Paceibacterota bacterium]